MRIERRYTKDGQSPYAEIEFRLTTSEIRNPDATQIQCTLMSVGTVNDLCPSVRLADEDGLQDSVLLDGGTKLQVVDGLFLDRTELKR